MLLVHWLKSLFTRPARTYKRRATPQKSRRRGLREKWDQSTANLACAESLEDRTLLATFTVDIVNDENDGNFNAGDLSLREAIFQANANAGDDTINFTSGLAGMTILLTDTSDLTDGGTGNPDLDITDTVGTLTINGLGADQLTISGNNTSKIFDVAANTTVVISGLTITNGRASAGAGITNTGGNVTLIDSVISSNTATIADGGGIRNSSGGTLLVRGSTINNNFSDANGGGIANISTTTGAVTILNSTLSQNSAAANGGGVFTAANAVNTTIVNSTITQNVAESGQSSSGTGGGIFVGTGGTETLVNTIIAGNIQDGSGANDLDGASGGVIETAFNNLIGDAGSAGNLGTTVPGSVENNIIGAVANTVINPTLAITNGGRTPTHALVETGQAINTGNTARATTTGTAAGTALATDQRGFPFARIHNVSLLMLPSGANGTTIAAGDTITLQRADSAIVTFEFTKGIPVNPANVAIAIQNGQSTLQVANSILAAFASVGFDGELSVDGGDVEIAIRETQIISVISGAPITFQNPMVDIGAIELQSLTLIVDNNGGVSDGDFSSGQLSLREAVELTNTNPGADRITFAAGLADQTITLGGSELAITGDVAITGLGASSLTISGGGASRIFNVAEGGNAEIADLELINGNAAGGGAIQNAGDLILRRLYLHGNSSSGIGGAITSDDDLTTTIPPMLTVVDSTISGNTAVTGGGLFVRGGTLRLINSTVSGNTANAGGGGGLVVNDNGTATITNTTFTGNAASFGTVAQFDAGTTVSINNTILDGTVTGGGFTGGNNLVTGANFNLTVLQDNGGPTPTHGLLTGSDAIDAGNNASALNELGLPLLFDQRGVSRILDGNGDTTATVDIGAVERTSVTAVTNGNTLELTGSALGDAVSISVSAGNVVINTGEAFQQFATTGLTSIQFDGGDGNDTLTVDASVLAAGLDVVFNGEGQTGGTGDGLNVTGGTFGNVVYNTNGGGAGELEFDGTRTITFTGLEPLDITGTAVSGTLTININDANGTANETIQVRLEDDEAGNGLDDTTIANPNDGIMRLVLVGLMEDLVFDATGLTNLVINGDVDDNDQISIVSQDNAFNANLTIDGRGGLADSINFTNGLNFGAANLNLTAESITQSAGAEVITTGSTTLNAGTTGTIILNDADNNFGTVSISQANTATLRDTNAINFGTSTVTGSPTSALNVTAGGNITQTASSALTVTGTTTLNSGASNITLAEAGNNFATVSSTANNVNLTDADDLNFDASTITGTLMVITTDNITQSGDLNINGATTLNAGTGDVILERLGNDFNTLTVTAADDVRVKDANALILNGINYQGSIELEAGELTNIGVITDNAVGNFARLTADVMALETGTINVLNNSLLLRQRTSGRNIDLGTEDAGRLSLTDAELDTITADTIRVGDGSAGSDVKVSADITVDEEFFINGDTIDLEANITTTNEKLTLSGDVILSQVNTRTLDTGIGTRGVEIDGTVNDDGGISNRTLIINTDAGEVRFMGQVGNTLAPGSVIVSSAGLVDFQNTVSIADLLDVTADAVEFDNTLTVVDNISLTADEIDFNGGVNSVSTTNNGSIILAPRTANQNIAIGGATDSGAGTLDITDTELLTLADGFSEITIGDETAGTGSVTVTSSLFRDFVTIVGGSVSVTELNAGANDVSLVARVTNITDGGDGGTDITGGNVKLDSVTGVATAADFLTTTISSLAARATTSGGVFVTDTDQLVVTTVDSLAGITTNNGDITLTASGAANSLDIAQAVNSGGGAVQLNGANGVILSTGMVNTSNGTYNVDANTNNNTTGTYTQVGAAQTVVTGSGAASIRARDVVLGGVISGTSTLTFILSDDALTIGIGNDGTGGNGGGIFNLSDTDLSNLADGFTQITIGNSLGSGAVEIDSATFNDPVSIIGGQVDVDGLISTGNAVTITSNAPGKIITNANALAVGNDIVGSIVTLNGVVAPGGSPGQMVVDGNLVLSSDDTYEVEINGSAPGTGYDQIVVTGNVILNDGGNQAMLSPTRLAAFVPNVGQEFVIIDNQGAGTTTGTFNGFADDSIFAINNVLFQIDYQGGTGNDVTLTVIAPNTVYVDDDFVGTADGVDPAGPGLVFGYDTFATIQEGVNQIAAGPGNTVNVADGTYNENVTIGKDLTLDGQGTGTILNATGGNGITLIDSPNTLANLTISDLRITGANTGLLDNRTGMINSLSLSQVQIDGSTVQGGSLNGIGTITTTLTAAVDIVNVDGTQFDATTVNTINYQNVTALNINGSAGADTFNVDPIATPTNVTLNGGAPATTPGDNLIYNGPGVLSFDNASDGNITQTGFTQVNFTGIESATTDGVTGSNGNFIINAGDDANDGDGDEFIARRNGANLEIIVVSDLGAEVVVFSQAAANVVSITIQGSNDNDKLTVDYGNNVANPPIPTGGLFYNGGGNGIGDNDVLVIEDGTVLSVEHTFINSSNGFVSIESTTNTFQTITYTGLEPITDTLVAGDRTFTFGPTSDLITLSDDFPNVAGISQLSSAGTSETVDFANPTGSLTINMGSGNDTIDILALDAAFNANVEINGGSGQDTFNLNATTDGTPATVNTYTLNGNSGADTFNISPTLATGPDITINGDAPTTSPGDTLNYDGSAAVTTTTLGNGTLTPAPANQAIAFNSIEALNTANPPELSIVDVTLPVNNNEAFATRTFEVRLSRGIVQPVTVDVTTANGSALAGSDFTSFTQTLTFNSATLVQTVMVTVSQDNIVELNEEFFVNLSNATGAVIADGTATGIITDDDGPATITIGSPIAQTETDSGLTNFVFTISLDKPVDAPISFTAEVLNGTAMAGSDFLANVQTVTFLAGETSKTFTVQVQGDETVELDENFTVNLRDLQVNGRNVAFSGPGPNLQATGTIVNDDSATLTIEDVSLVEGNSGTSVMTFTVTLSDAVQGGVSVDYDTANGSATAGSDYVTAGGTLNFLGNAGETMTFDVTINGDTLVEPDETFTVNLNSITAANVTGGPDATGTILNDDLATISINDVTNQDENLGTFTFEVTLSGTVSEEVQVVVNSQALTAETTDFTPITNQVVTFLANSTGAALTQMVTVTVTGDTIVEGDETFELRLSNATVGNLSDPSRVAILDGVGQGVINNDDQTTLSINNVSQNESDDGTTAFVFTVTSSHAVEGGFTVNGATAPGSALTPSDFITVNSTLSFAGIQGEQRTFTVQVNGDEIVEPDEDFTVSLTSRTPLQSDVAATDILLPAAATGTILNDDQASLTIEDVSLVEGNSGTSMMRFTVTLSDAVQGGVSVDYDTANGSATAGSDYVTAGGTLNFLGNAGETMTFDVTINGDTLVEPDETFTVNLNSITAANVTAGPDATGTILNDDLATISINDVTNQDENLGTFTFEVTLSGTVSEEVQVVVNSQALTAETTDFTPITNQVVTFLANSTGAALTQMVTVTVTGDTIVEGNETFELRLSNATVGNLSDPSRVAILDGVGQGVINNDDQTTLSINNVSQNESDDGTTAFVFTVTSSHAVEGGFTVNGATAPDSALTPSDFITVNSTLSFAGIQGEQRTFTVQVNGDEIVEPDEDFTVSLTSRTPLQSDVAATDILLPAAATGTILNDDQASLTIEDVSLVEGNSGTSVMTFTVTLSHAVQEAFTVNFTTVDGTATAVDLVPVLDDNDYETAAGTRTFGATNPMQQTIEVTINGDMVVEPDETFSVQLTTTAEDINIGPNAIGTIINDDSLLSIAPLSANQLEGTGGPGTPFAFTVTRVGDSRGTVTVNYQVAAGTTNPANGTDFVGGVFPGGQVVFAPGETTKILNIFVGADDVIEMNEEFTVSLVGPVIGNAQIDTANDEAAGVIQNDDADTISIAANSADRLEGSTGGQTPFTFTLSRTGAAIGFATVDYIVTGAGPGTIFANPVDFGGAFPTGQVVFSPGQTSQILTIFVDADTIVEPNEEFTVTLTNPSSNATINQATAVGTIQNDDNATISVNNVTMNEGDSGPTTFTFTATLSAPVQEATSATFTVSGPTADTADFGGAFPTGTVMFAAGQTTRTFTVAVNGDLDVEPDETFLVTISNIMVGGATSTTVTPGTAGTGTIQNDDIDLTIAQLNSELAEGTSGPGTPYTFTVNRLGDLRGTTIVDFAVSGSSSNPANLMDFGGAFPGGQIVFAAGVSSQVLTVLVSPDAVVEPDEEFTVTLSNPTGNAQINTATATGEIQNDDNATISVNNVTMNEGDSGPTTFTFTATLSAPVQEATSATFTVSGPTADTADFGGAFPTGTVMFAAGQTTRTFTVAVNGDLDVEPDETFSVTISNIMVGGATSTTVTPGTAGTGTIQNDDIDLTIAQLNSELAEGTSGPGTPYTFTVNRLGDLRGTTIVDFAVSGSSSNPANLMDFGGAFPGGQIVFAAGVSSQVLTVLVSSDAVVEPDEEFTVTLSNPTGNAQINTATATGEIQNDDNATISVNNVTMNEGDSGPTTFTFTATLSAPVQEATSATFTVSGPTTDTADFGGAFPTGTVMFAAGQTTRTFTVAVNGDLDVEPDETFSVTISNIMVGGATSTTVTPGTTGTGTIVNDDTQVSLEASSPPGNPNMQSEGNAGDTIYSYIVRRTGDLRDVTTVRYSVAGSTSVATPTAADALDFGGALPSGEVLFNPGEEAKTIVVLVRGDQIVEMNEQFTISLLPANPVVPTENASIGTGSVDSVIVNDDAGLISINDVTKLEGDTGITSFVFTVTLDRQIQGDVTLDVRTQNGEAQAPSDFTSIPLNMFSLGQTDGLTQIVEVFVNGDTAVELDETFQVIVDNLNANGFNVDFVGGGLDPLVGTGTILNDDSATISISDLKRIENPPISGVFVDPTEANAGQFEFDVTLTDPVGETVMIDLNLFLGTAEAEDFLGTDVDAGNMILDFGTTETLVFNPGDPQTKTVRVNVLDETIVELDETFQVRMNNLRFAGAAVTTNSPFKSRMQLGKA